MTLALALCACQAAEERKEAPRAGVNHIAHAVKGINCVRCHSGFDSNEPQGTLHLPTDASCVACHEDAHPEITDKTCSNCHVDEDTPALLAAMKKDLDFDHPKHIERSKGDCVRCHQGAVEPTLDAKGAIPAMDDCRRCHETWFDGTHCEACHRSLSAFPLKPVTDQAHTADFLRRHGLEAVGSVEQCATCHTQTFCAECHDNRSPLPPDLAHADRPDRPFIHRTGYQDRHAAEARIEGPLCLSCHTERECTTCHSLAGRGPGDPTPHPAGWASPGPGANAHAVEARRDILACAACHSGPGAQICVTCHAEGRPGGSPHGGRRVGGDPLHDRPCVECHRR